MMNAQKSPSSHSPSLHYSFNDYIPEFYSECEFLRLACRKRRPSYPRLVFAWTNGEAVRGRGRGEEGRRIKGLVVRRRVQTKTHSSRDQGAPSVRLFANRRVREEALATLLLRTRESFPSKFSPDNLAQNRLARRGFAEMPSTPSYSPENSPTKVKPGSIPGRVTPGFSRVGIVPDDATGRRVFSGDLPFSPPLRSSAAPYSPQSPSSHCIFVRHNELTCTRHQPRKMSLLLPANILTGAPILQHLSFKNSTLVLQNHTKVLEATVAERLACSPPIMAIRAQSPAGSIPDFRMWESYRKMPLVSGFSRGSPVSPTLTFRHCTILTSVTLIGSICKSAKRKPVAVLADEPPRSARRFHSIETRDVFVAKRANAAPALRSTSTVARWQARQACCVVCTCARVLSAASDISRSGGVTRLALQWKSDQRRGGERIGNHSSPPPPPPALRLLSPSSYHPSRIPPFLLLLTDCRGGDKDEAKVIRKTRWSEQTPITKTNNHPSLHPTNYFAPPSNVLVMEGVGGGKWERNGR
ncbi:hypothetical protein PR048_023020 [Dryococelus australis]|uniref:Uncharacterized protein n=1 Tax=Dryococelus australis TaxID=614101 RepID=A0ABQ9GSY3_9NEOP|nr:hypothetical protein PR048_023020 [Dryococelus australis]